MTATIPQTAIDAAATAAAEGIAGYQGFSLSAMEADSRSLIEQDALAAVAAAVPIIAAAALDTRADETPAEHLYERVLVEDLNGHLGYEVRQYAITKRTAKKIFFAYRPECVKVVDRVALERNGYAWIRAHGGFRVYAHLADAQGPAPETSVEKVSRLRAAMAAVHPDRGGDPGEFRAAYARYRGAVNAHTKPTPAT